MKSFVESCKTGLFAVILSGLMALIGGFVAVPLFLSLKVYFSSEIGSLPEAWVVETSLFIVTLISAVSVAVIRFFFTRYKAQWIDWLLMVGAANALCVWLGWEILSAILLWEAVIVLLAFNAFWLGSLFLSLVAFALIKTLWQQKITILKTLWEIAISLLTLVCWLMLSAWKCFLPNFKQAHQTLLSRH